jgi:hypothetical protein
LGEISKQPVTGVRRWDGAGMAQRCHKECNAYVHNIQKNCELWGDRHAVLSKLVGNIMLRYALLPPEPSSQLVATHVIIALLYR